MVFLLEKRPILKYFCVGLSENLKIGLNLPLTWSNFNFPLKITRKCQKIVFPDNPSQNFWDQRPFWRQFENETFHKIACKIVRIKDPTTIPVHIAHVTGLTRETLRMEEIFLPKGLLWRHHAIKATEWRIFTFSSARSRPGALEGAFATRLQDLKS